MAQVDSEEKNAIKFNQYSKNEAVATTGSLVNVLTVAMRALTQGNFVIHN